jgi:hypothetical protein
VIMIIIVFSGSGDESDKGGSSEGCFHLVIKV